MIDHFPTFSRAVSNKLNSFVGEIYTVDPEGLYTEYLAAFPPGTNPLYKERTEHDCSCCRNFIKNLGNTVCYMNGKWHTVWDVEAPAFYQVVADRLAQVVRQRAITGVLRVKERSYGAERTLQLVDTLAHTWHHFYGVVPARCYSATPGEARGFATTSFDVLKRGLTELTPEAINTVLDLIDSNSLYRGEEHAAAVRAFAALRAGYDSTDLYVWRHIGSPAARFRNTVIGTLVTDISTGTPVDDAVRMFESKVAPTNYRRPTALITPGMIKQAVAKLQELGLEEAVHRRFAHISDVSVRNVLWVDNSVRPLMKNLTSTLLGTLKPTVNHARDISVENFFTDIVPTAESISLHVENRHMGNFVSLTTSDCTAKLFQWDNSFAWSYDGEVTDVIKERVKNAGGNVNALLRVSLSWHNYDDLDLHCMAPGRSEIYYGNKQGILDVDMNAGSGMTREPVENLAFTSLSDGVYHVSVNQYSKRESTNVGFEIQYEFNNEVRNFAYKPAVSGRIDVVNIEVRKGVPTLTISSNMTETAGATTQVEKWGVTTGTYVPVDTIMLSPNHWDDQRVGNRHWFFMLKNCRNPLPARGIYNEFLRNDLTPHRKVFEVLGSQTKCQPTQDQLSGIGFSSTTHATATFQVVRNGQTSTYNVQF